MAVEDGPVFQHREPFQPDPVLSRPDDIRVGDRVPLPAPAGREVEGVVDSISRTAGDRTVLRGTIEAAPFGHWVISVAPDGRQLASIHLDRENTEYFVRYDPASEGHLLGVLDLASLPEEAPCETCIREAAGDVMEFDSGAEVAESGFSTMTSGGDESSLTTIDVMVVYTPAAAAWADKNNGGIDALVLDATARAQLAMDNSEGLIDFRLVHSAAVDYQEHGDGWVDLMRLTETFGPYGDYLNEVHALRNQHGADLVTMLVEGVDYGGIAWLLRSMDGDPGGAFSISRARQAATAYTMAHEMGHNLGLAHDAANTGSGGMFDYSFGWQWKGSNGKNYSSVMAYPASNRVPYFSNPDISFMDAPTGDPSLADNARTLRQTRHVIAAYREPVTARSLFLVDWQESLQTGESRVLTVEIRDSTGNRVAAGEDSDLTVTLRRISGQGEVQGLGSVSADEGAASLVITGGTNPGGVVVEASTENTAGEILTAQIAFDVVALSVTAGSEMEVDSLVFDEGEMEIAGGGALIIERLEVASDGHLEIRGDGVVRVGELILGPGAGLASAGSVEVSKELSLPIGGSLRVDGNLVLESGANGLIDTEAGVAAGSLVIEEGARLSVNNANLAFGEAGAASHVAGDLELFHGLGSTHINGDLTVSGTLRGLVSDLHLAEGVFLNVSQGGEIVFDGCLIDSAGVGFTLNASAGAKLWMVRSVFENGTLKIDSGAVVIRDNLFADAGVEVEAGADGAAVYHNFVDRLDTFLTVSGSPRLTVEVDGWGNVEDRNRTRNDLGIELSAAGLKAGRSLDADGNLFIQPGDSIEAYVAYAALAHGVDRAGFTAGYSTDYFSEAVIESRGGWLETSGGSVTGGAIGGWHGVFDHSSSGGTLDDGEVVRVGLTAHDREGRTVLFLMDGNSLESSSLAVDPALRRASNGDLLTPFTMNSGYVTIDGTAPRIADGAVILQDQGGWTDMTVSGAVVEQGDLLVSFEAFDALSGIDESDVSVTLIGFGGAAGEVIEGNLVDASSRVWIDDEEFTEFLFSVPVTAAAWNGDYLVRAVVGDRSGNTATLDLGEVTVNKNEIDVDLSLQGFTAGTDASPLTVEVTFVFTDAFGSVLEERVADVLMGTANLDVFTFKQVPEGTAHLSAKAPKHLRRRLPAGPDANGQATVKFTESNRLLAGDLTGDNAVRSSDLNLFSTYWLQNVADNPAAAMADINGDGRVRSVDLTIFQSNWLVSGDPK